MHEGYTYDVFISYRTGIELDAEIGHALQKELESFAVPRSLRRALVNPKQFKNRIRVFRDKTDIPVTHDLNKTIEAKLKQSRSLVVVCSLDTPLSEHCRKEVQYFSNLHGEDRIFTVLITGSPEESVFPLFLEKESHYPPSKKIKTWARPHAD